jgi:hypothetical protein
MPPARIAIAQPGIKSDRVIPTHPFNRLDRDWLYSKYQSAQDTAMTIKELLLQEIDSTPEEMLTELLSLVRSLKSSPNSQLNIYEQLLERIDYLEAIIGIRKGLESFSRGEGIPADQAMTVLQQQFNIPPRP